MESHGKDSRVKGLKRRFSLHLSQVIQIQQYFLRVFCKSAVMNAPISDTFSIKPATNASSQCPYSLPLHSLAALRILIILVVGLGYASTIGIGGDSSEWGRHWGYDPSWYGLQMLFILSGFLAMRTMSQGRSIQDFFLSRLKSLWPALIAATLVSVLCIYPIMCAPDAPVRMSLSDLGLYFFKTILLIDPGSRMPGLMDDAKYMCLLQGAIWTLRWGLILHIAFLIGWTTRLLQKPKLLLALCIGSIAAYVGIVDASVQNENIGNAIHAFAPGLRFGYAYLIGATLFSWQHVLRLNKRRIILSSLAIAIATSCYFVFLPWSSVIEILGVAFWLTLCFGFLHNAPAFMKSCPRLAPLLYVSIWPTAQIIVALAPSFNQMDVILTSTTLALASAVLMFLLLRKARIQPARL